VRAAGVACCDVHDEVHADARAVAVDHDVLGPAVFADRQRHPSEAAVCGVERRSVPDRAVARLLRAQHVLLPALLVADVGDGVEDALRRVVEVERDRRSRLYPVTDVTSGR
jgi:hypothetical protein